MTASERDTLRRDAAALGCVLDEPALERLLAYRDLIVRWNRIYNLTAVRDPAQMLTQHLLDSLAVVAPLRHRLVRLQPRTSPSQPRQDPRITGITGTTSDTDSTGTTARPQRLLDVGSGGGLPGVVIAIVEPALDVTCIDAVAKKATFIRQVAAELRLPNLQAVHGRVEALHAAPFDIVTSRAFASLADFTRLTRHLLAPDGVWMAMKGPQVQAELAELAELAPPPELAPSPTFAESDTPIETLAIEDLQVPGLGAQRCLVWLQPQR